MTMNIRTEQRTAIRTKDERPNITKDQWLIKLIHNSFLAYDYPSWMSKQVWAKQKKGDELLSKVPEGRA